MLKPWSPQHKNLGDCIAGKDAFENTENINKGFHNFQNAPPPADHAPPDLPTGAPQYQCRDCRESHLFSEKGTDRWRIKSEAEYAHAEPLLAYCLGLLLMARLREECPVFR